MASKYSGVPLPRGKNATLTNTNQAIANLQRNMARRTPPSASGAKTRPQQPVAMSTTTTTTTQHVAQETEETADPNVPLSANAKTLLGEINNFDLFTNKQQQPQGTRMKSHPMPTPSPPKMGRPPGVVTPQRPMPKSTSLTETTSSSGVAVSGMSCGDDEPIPTDAPMMSDAVMNQHIYGKRPQQQQQHGGVGGAGTDNSDYGMLDEGPYHGSIVRLLSPEEQREREAIRKATEEEEEKQRAATRPTSAGVGTQSMPTDGAAPNRKQVGTLLKPHFLDSLRKYSTYLYFDTLCAERDMAVREESEQLQQQ